MKLSKRHFFSRLSYSFGNEDPSVERRALDCKNTDRVLCITASGDRPLHLLLDECHEIVAIDLNETQNHLLALKVQAMQQFDYEHYLSFLGGIEDTHRIAKLQLLLPHLNENEKQFWTKHEPIIAKGVIYQGAVERLCKRFASALRLVRRHKVKKLFEFEDLEEQKHFIKNHWNSFFWRKSFSFLFNSPIMRLFLKDPGVFSHLGKTISPGQYICQRLTQNLETTLASKNPFISLILRGYVDPKAFPPYLTEKGVETIKPRLNKLSWESRDVIAYLEDAPSSHFDCFSLSDIASYMDQHNFHRLLRAVHRTARPGARFSMRQFMSDHPIPDDLSHAFSRNTDLENSLEAEECCFVYRFMAGTISK
ncbi:MAG: DUF3419 family protein [Parachlamydiaceae bacterium]|nr:DUF3419 family protein [Parachlamydiaceae bacterium]